MSVEIERAFRIFIFDLKSEINNLPSAFFALQNCNPPSSSSIEILLKPSRSCAPSAWQARMGAAIAARDGGPTFLRKKRSNTCVVFPTLRTVRAQSHPVGNPNYPFSQQ